VGPTVRTTLCPIGSNADASSQEDRPNRLRVIFKQSQVRFRKSKANQRLRRSVLHLKTKRRSVLHLKTKRPSDFMSKGINVWSIGLHYRNHRHPEHRSLKAIEIQYEENRTLLFDWRELQIHFWYLGTISLENKNYVKEKKGILIISEAPQSRVAPNPPISASHRWLGINSAIYGLPVLASTGVHP
jgi:hypothetical protein